MAERTDIVSQLSPHLFWDVDTNDYDIDKHKTWTIQRVLEYGELSDWRLILHYYGLQEIGKACKRMRTLDPRCLSFICLLTNTRKEEYRCYNIGQSLPTLWNS